MLDRFSEPIQAAIQITGQQKKKGRSPFGHALL